MATKSKLTVEQVTELARLYTEEAKTYQDLATLYGISMATVANTLHKAGVVTRGRGRPKGSKNSKNAIAGEIFVTQNEDGFVSVSI